MIKLYDKTGEVLIGELEDCISCNVTEVRNGIFDARLVYPAMRLISNNLIKENIIVCKASDILLNQKFRIFNVKKKHSNTIEVIARHISFDLLYDFIENINIVNQSCEYALNTIFRNSQFSRRYKGHSDIINAQDYNISMTNCLNAIAGKEGSIIDTYGTGAEILRDNENIHVLNRRGHDNGVVIEYGKNLEGFECTEDTTDLITRIYPFAKKSTPDGETTITLNEKFVDSPRINLYSHPYIRDVDLTSKFKDEDEINQAKLKLEAEKYFLETKCDIPKLTFNLKPVPLSKCVGFENLGEKLSLCDIATIKHKIYGITTQAKVIKTVFNVLTDRYENIQLGDPKASLGDLIGGNSGNAPQVGPPGPPGPPGQDGNIGDFPDSLPAIPQLTANVLGFASVDLSWTYENKVYYNYQVFASKTENFEPNMFDLIFEGQASSFLHQVKPNETWYYRARAVNTHGSATELSTQLKVVTRKIDDMTNYFEEVAIGKAVVGSLTSDYMEAGIIKGHWVDAKNLSVTDGNGKRTLDIDSYGNVSLDVKTLKIRNENVATEKEIESKLTKFELEDDKIKFLVEQRANIRNIVPNGNFEGGTLHWWGEPTEEWFYWDVYKNYESYGFNGRNVLSLKNVHFYNKEKRAYSAKCYPVEQNTDYTLNFHYCVEQNIQECRVYVILSNTLEGTYEKVYTALIATGGEQSDTRNDVPHSFKFNTLGYKYVWLSFNNFGMKQGSNWQEYHWFNIADVAIYKGDVGAVKFMPNSKELYSNKVTIDKDNFRLTFENGNYAQLGRLGIEQKIGSMEYPYHCLGWAKAVGIPVGNPGKVNVRLPDEFDHCQKESINWSVAQRGYYYNTSGAFFPFYVQVQGERIFKHTDGHWYVEIHGYSRVQNANNPNDVQNMPGGVNAMLTVNA